MRKLFLLPFIALVAAVGGCSQQTTGTGGDGVPPATQGNLVFVEGAPFVNENTNYHALSANTRSRSKSGSR